MLSEGCINSAAHIENNNSVIEGDAQKNTILAHTGMPFYCVCLNCALCVLPSAPAKHYCLCLVKEIQNTDLRNIYMSLTTFQQPFSVFLLSIWCEVHQSMSDRLTVSISFWDVWRSFSPHKTAMQYFRTQRTKCAYNEVNTYLQPTETNGKMYQSTRSLIFFWTLE